MPFSVRTLSAVASMTTLFGAGCTLFFGLDGIADGSLPDASVHDASADGGLTDAALDVAAKVDACDGNYAQDPHNCGQCGHDCLGGGCVANRCQPFVIATGVNDPEHIVVDGTRVYWLNYGPTDSANQSLVRENSLERAEKDGGDRRLLYSTTSWRYPYGLAVNATYVFWSSESGAILRVDKETGADTTLVQDPAAPHGMDLDPDAGLVYWINDNAGVSKITVDGTGQQLLGQVDAGFAIAIDDTYIFVAGGGNWNGIQRLPRSGCPDASACGTTIFDKGALAMAVDKGRLFVITVSDGIVESPTDGGPQTVVTVDTTAGSVAIDRDFVYWVTYTEDGGVFRKRRDASLVEPMVAGGQSYPGAIAVDDEAVYWVNRGTRLPPYTTEVFGSKDGTVMKVAK